MTLVVASYCTCLIILSTVYCRPRMNGYMYLCIMLLSYCNSSYSCHYNTASASVRFSVGLTLSMHCLQSHQIKYHSIRFVHLYCTRVTFPSVVLSAVSWFYTLFHDCYSIFTLDCKKAFRQFLEYPLVSLPRAVLYAISLL